MTRLLPALVAVAALALAGATMLDPLTFASGSSITVRGTSNVHGWTCTSTQVGGSANAAAAATGWTGLSALTVRVPVSSLDCRNRTMNGKLRSAFNAPANPNIQFTLTNARVTAPSGGRFTVTANGTLAMAGQSRPVAVTAQGQVVNGRYKFTGSVPVTMSQWGIRPPTALGGTMRTGDRVTVEFDVTLAR